jgi:Mechanosensitive ion channel
MELTNQKNIDEDPPRISSSANQHRPTLSNSSIPSPILVNSTIPASATFPDVSKPSLCRLTTPNSPRDRNKFHDVYSDDSFISGDMSPRGGTSSQVRTSPKQMIRLNDILKVNPLESEAETLILKALERQDAQAARSRANTGNGSLLGNVPSEAMDVFDDEKKGSSMDEFACSHVTSFEQRSRPPRPPPPPRVPKPALDRNQTTEETLAALTMQMEGFQDNYHPAEDARLLENVHVLSAAEAFAQQANLVFKGPSKVKFAAAPPAFRRPSLTPSAEAPIQPNLTTGAKHWATLRSAVQSSTLAELQGIPDQDPDVEIGTDQPYDEPDATLMPAKTFSNGRPNKNLHFPNVSKGAVQDLQLFVHQRRRAFLLYARLLLLLVIPALTAACILFYFCGNVPTGKVDLEASMNGTFINTNGGVIEPNQASASWWILFVCVRQALTFSMAQLLQVFVIDFLCLNTRFFKTLFGNLVTLLIAQSKGWPFIAFTWGLLDFALLYGNNEFAGSWLYWQGVMDVFNAVNPGGSVTSNVWNRRILAIAVSMGIAVSLKRLWLGLFLGKKTFSHYAEELTNVVKKALLLCEVATLARDLYFDSNGGAVKKAQSVTHYGMSKEALSIMLRKSAPENTTENGNDKCDEGGVMDDGMYNGGLIIEGKRNDMLRDHLDQSQRMRITELLGAWEEPEAEGGSENNVTISSILQFRNSLSILDNNFMFGIAWGDVSTRAKMVLSSQEVYQRLLLSSPNSEVLQFDVLARVALEPDGNTLNQEKVEALIRLLRPDRDGNLSLLDFVKSTDGVYKEAKLLRASIRNSEHIDRAFEKAINVVFYTVLTCIILSRIGIDPIALFLSLSGLILAFAFMIGSASSKMFEGFLFILVRRPYNIGDRIHISNVEADTDPTGSSGWIVKDVTLFHTTLVYGATGERATIANGSLAASRVINMARSPKACVGIDLKFATDAPYERIKLYEQSLRDFVKARPREWANFNGFRAGTICADLGYIEYSVSLSHREAWQNIVSIVNSKAEVAAFCLELSKQLDLRVTRPALPVDLNLTSRDLPNQPNDNESLSAKAKNFFGGTGYVPVSDGNDE